MGSGQIASACSAVRLAVEYDGCGMRKIMSGRRCTRNNKSDGFMLMHVKKPGINRDYTQRVS